MFVQIIEGRTTDAEGLRRQGDRWQAELRPGAVGYLGVTSGVTSDGRALTMVRFDSEASARANSDRPEQSAWWAEMEKYYDGDITFAESSDVADFRGGGSDTAGFVQVMKVTGADRAMVERMDAAFEAHPGLRPDVIGGLRTWTGPDSYIDVMYFTSEADARAGEQAGMPEELQALMAELDASSAKTEFFDLTDPQLD